MQLSVLSLYFLDTLCKNPNSSLGGVKGHGFDATSLPNKGKPSPPSLSSMKEHTRLLFLLEGLREAACPSC